MEQGYSILLGEHVDASLLAHRDCAPLQMVCPACYEPLFKSVRQQQSTTRHYLSHYREDKSYNTDCALRVRSTGKEVIERQNKLAKDQRLSFFLRKFAGLLAADPFISYTKGFEWTQREIVRPKIVRLLRKAIYEDTVEAGLSAGVDEISLCADQYFQEMASFGEVPKTEFSMSVQKRIAMDMYKALYSAPQRPNQAYLFGHGLLVLYSKFLNISKHRHDTQTDFEANLTSCLEGLLSGDATFAERALVELRNNMVGPPHVQEPTYAINFLAIELTYEMVGTLVRLPYFTLLKQYVAAKGEGEAVLKMTKL